MALDSQTVGNEKIVVPGRRLARSLRHEGAGGLTPVFEPSAR
ncbi:hypothetical protein ACWC09_00205 [Streptomyces sp. NPDC001617]